MSETAETVVPGDLLVRKRKVAYEGDLHVNGWVEIIEGELACTGALTCLGLTIEGRAELRCRELVANVIEVDARNWLDALPPDGAREGTGPTMVRAERVKARVVHTVQLGLADIIARGDLEADYYQHDGNELNPSWDYAKGNRSILQRDYFEARREDEEPVDDEPVLLDFRLLRKTLTAGDNPFTRALLVERHVRKPTAGPAPVRPPEVAAFERWLDAHPGPQRATLEALDAELAAFGDASAEVRAAVRKLIVRAIKSPKLKPELDARLARLGW
ncbi:MAG: hypothetical protein R3B48_28870 [Kofleriaceae bacterium]